MTGNKAAPAYIALGSNQDNPRRHIGDALDELAKMANSTLVRASSLYRSAPVGPQDQPDYLNAVARMDTTATPIQLLRQLQAIEQAHGRTRSQRWGARTLDLDILLYAEQQHSDKDLQIPHPAMCERAFVLCPLAEIAPDIDIPGYGNIQKLLPQVAGQNIQLAENGNVPALA